MSVDKLINLNIQSFHSILAIEGCTRRSQTTNHALLLITKKVKSTVTWSTNSLYIIKEHSYFVLEHERVMEKKRVTGYKIVNEALLKIQRPGHTAEKAMTVRFPWKWSFLRIAKDHGLNWSIVPAYSNRTTLAMLLFWTFYNGLRRLTCWGC